MERVARTGSMLGVALAMLLAGGCATPIGVRSLGEDTAYAQIDRSALNSRGLSSYTTVILHRYDLDRLSKESPARCLVELHHKACNDDRRDILFALAELSFSVGEKNRRFKVDGKILSPENFFAASATYAYLFLLGPGKEALPESFDRRFRIACDLYNRSVNYVIMRNEENGSFQGRTWLLPVGSIVTGPGRESDFTLPPGQDKTFISADRFRIHGLSVRNRNAGMGAPVMLVDKKRPAGALSAGSPATLFIRVQGGLSDFTTGKLRGNVELYSAFSRDHVIIDGRIIPLEEDLTTPIAYALNNPDYWRLEKLLFRLGQAPFKPGIYPSQPCQAGKIPVLFVHGTMSSPVWWAEMWNTLMGDPTLREKYQFWFYLYDSAKPVAQSALHLRSCIEDLVRQLDPDGQDALLRQMVVIGHSQGGLLTKLTATHTGEAMVQALTGRTLAQLKLSPEDEKRIRQLSIFEPLPEVKRVVFIATPHRGSYRAGGLVRKLARRFLTLPKQALETTAELLTLAPKIDPNVKLAETSIDSMAPDNKAMLAMADIPVTPPIKAHSIIAIKGDDIPPEGSDGVVKYASAHIEGVESELVVRSRHSCQSNPVTIEEVRRILLEHLRPGDGTAPSNTASVTGVVPASPHPSKE